MSLYRHILVAYDGSADADAALEHAIQLARDQQASITLLSVAPPPQQPAAIGAPPTPDLLGSFSDSEQVAAERIPADIDLRAQIARGDPGETILHVASGGEHDLLVMGSHGHGRMHRALLGSVSQRVLHDSPVPVLLIRRPDPDVAGAGHGEATGTAGALRATPTD
jgi:nucleotide-binding universal stress UspA family protein